MRRQLLLCLVLAGCGARTGLLAPDDAGGSPAPQDAAVDPATDPAAEPSPDSNKSDCTDPSITYVYVVTQLAHLYSYRPATASFTLKGTLDCPGTGGTPFSMGVDRKGNGYVVYSDGKLFKISTATGKCQSTGFVPGMAGFELFGMGFSTDQAGPSEKLFLAASAFNTGFGEPTLGWLDVASYQVTPLGPLQDPGMELTGTGDGRLYGFFDTGASAHLVQLDKDTGAYLSDEPLPGVAQGQAWAFAFWGGDFWFFTAPYGYSVVTRYQPDSKQITEVAKLPNELIVGAGVSTCAPEN
jgi:hypothetical protein